MREKPDCFGVTVESNEVHVLLPDIPKDMNGVALTPAQARHFAECLMVCAQRAEINQKRLTAQFN